MCNLYHMSPKGAFEVYVRRHLSKLWLPEAPAKAVVGPFGEGQFLRTDGDGGLLGVNGQWGLIRPGSPTRISYGAPKPSASGKTSAPRPLSTNNARAETIATLPTYRDAWKAGRRCLVPASWYQEPNWESGKNIWWQLTRLDGLPWMLAGLWNEWVDHVTGEVVPSFTMVTVNCDDHPLLSRLHRPDPKLPADKQDKRAVVHVEPEHWEFWLTGSQDAARELLVPVPLEMFDLSDAVRTDAVLASQRGASCITP